MSGRTHTDNQIIDAIIRHDGVLTHVCDELKIGYAALRTRMLDCPSILQAYESSVDKTTQEIGETLVTVAKEPAHKDWFRAAQFWLRVKGKWVEPKTLDITSGGERVTAINIIVDDPDTDDGTED